MKVIDLLQQCIKINTVSPPGNERDLAAFLADILSTAGKTPKRNGIIQGAFNDSIRYDLVTDDFRIKLFDFEEKDLNKIIQSVKA